MRPCHIQDPGADRERAGEPERDVGEDHVAVRPRFDRLRVRERVIEAGRVQVIELGELAVQLVAEVRGGERRGAGRRAHTHHCAYHLRG